MVDGVETEQEYEYGYTPAHDDPVKESNGDFSYIFIGWSPALETVTGDATYTAIFLEVRNCTKGAAEVSLVSVNADGTIVISVDSDLACAVGMMDEEGSVTKLSCTTEDGVHKFTVADVSATVVIVIKGDFDLNGKLQSRDATYMRQYLLDLRTLNEETAAISLFAGDVVGTDNSVSSRDATLIRQVLLEIKEPFAW